MTRLIPPSSETHSEALEQGKVRALAQGHPGQINLHLTSQPFTVAQPWAPGPVRDRRAGSANRREAAIQTHRNIWFTGSKDRVCPVTLLALLSLSISPPLPPSLSPLPLSVAGPSSHPALALDNHIGFHFLGWPHSRQINFLTKSTDSHLRREKKAAWQLKWFQDLMKQVEQTHTGHTLMSITIPGTWWNTPQDIFGLQENNYTFDGNFRENYLCLEPVTKTQEDINPSIWLDSFYLWNVLMRYWVYHRGGITSCADVWVSIWSANIPRRKTSIFSSVLK